MWTQADREVHRETGKRYPSDLSDGEWALAVPFFATYRPLSTTIRATGLFGSGHEWFVRWDVAEGPAARPGR